MADNIILQYGICKYNSLVRLFFGEKVLLIEQKSILCFQKH